MNLLFHLLLTLYCAVSVLSSCNSDEDCSLNGICTKNACVCDPGWISSDCGILDLRPATMNTGYNQTNIPNGPDFYASGAGNSSWCGQIVHDPNNSKLFHMFISVFSHGCGLSYWKPFSNIIRAESTSGPAGPYKYVSQVIDTWSHNPAVVYSPADKLYLLYYIGTPITPPTSCVAEKIGDNISIYNSADLRTWKHDKQVIVGETNPAPFPLYSSSNQTSTMLMAGGAGLGINMFVANSYAGPYNRIKTNPLFSNPNEDPCLWRDQRGNYHIIMHDLEEYESTGVKGSKVGSHAFAKSYDGPWTFNNNTLAYNTTVQFKNGATIDYYRRERPKLFFSEDGLMTPLYLVNGVQEKHAKGSYTLVQPIGSGAAAYEASLGF